MDSQSCERVRASSKGDTLMGWWALILAFILYIIVSIDLLIKKNYPLSIMLFMLNLCYIYSFVCKNGSDQVY